MREALFPFCHPGRDHLRRKGRRPGMNAVLEPLERRVVLAADLVASLSYTPGTYYPGQSIGAAMLNELNVGDAPADGYTTFIVLSADATLGNGDDVEMARVERRDDPITPGSVLRSSRTLTITTGLSGRYYVFVKVDAASEVDEDVEVNNVWMSPGADIVVSKPAVTMLVTDRTASETNANTGRIRFTRTGPRDAPLTVRYAVGGTINPSGSQADILPLSGTLVIPADQASAVLMITPIDDARVEGVERVEITLVADDAYTFVAGAVARIDINDNDGARVRVTASDASASESGPDSGTFTITRMGATDGDLLVKFSVGGTATPDSDYAAIGGEVTIPDGESSVTITVAPIDDLIGEVAETVVLTLSPSPSYLLVASRRTARVTIADNEPVVKIETTDARASESPTGSTGTAAYRVSRTGSSAAPLTVLYTLSGTATNGSDYETLGGTVVIPPGSLSATIVMTPIDDALAEPVETVILTLAMGEGYRVDTSRRRATANITDNEPVVSVVAGDATATETGPTTGTFTISRTGETTADLEVRFTLGGTAATDGSDYETVPTAVMIPAGASTATVTIRPIDDAAGEGSETVVLTLNARSTYTRNPSRATARITIADNEPTVSIFAADGSAAESTGEPNPGVFEVSRTGSTVGNLTVTYTVSGTAASDGSDYSVLSGSAVIPDGSSRATITVAPVDDAVAEASETVVLTLGTGTGYILSNSRRSATVTIADNEPVVSITATRSTTGEGAEAENALGLFTISRAAAADTPLTVNFTIGGTATETADYQAIGTSVTIPGGATSATVTIAPEQDARGEGDETVELTLTPGAAYSVLTTGGRNQARVTIRDDEPKVSIAATRATAAEADESDAILTLTRTGTPDQIASSLTVRYRVEGTADAGDDYEPLDGEVTFDPGSATATITVIAIDDDAGEASETVIVTLESEDDAEYVVDPGRASATVSITDNEPAVSVAATAAAAGENNRPGVFTVRRTGSTAEDLEITYTVSGTATSGADYAALSGTVTIPAGESRATITVTPIYDLLTEDSETVRITLTPGSGYRVDTAREATVTIANAPAVDLHLVSVGHFGRSYSLASSGVSSPIAAHISNMGIVSSGGFSLEFRLSTNTTWGDEDDIVVGTMSVASLMGGGSATVVFDFVFDSVKSRLDTGAYHLACRIDPTGRVAEASRTNNTYFSMTANVVVTA